VGAAIVDAGKIASTPTARPVAYLFDLQIVAARKRLL
jgi:hypothetical protein